MCLVTGPRSGELRFSPWRRPEAIPNPRPTTGCRSAGMLGCKITPVRLDLEKPSPPGAEEKVTRWPSCSGAPTGRQGPSHSLGLGTRGWPRAAGQGRADLSGGLRGPSRPHAGFCVLSIATRGAPRSVRGCGLRLAHNGQLAVTEALGWPFPAL